MCRSLTSIWITDFLSRWKGIIISPHTKCHIPLFGSLNLHSGECWRSGFCAVRCNKITKTTHHDTHRKLPNAIQLKSHNCINGNFTMKIWFPGKLPNSEMTTQANPRQRQKNAAEKKARHTYYWMKPLIISCAAECCSINWLDCCTMFYYRINLALNERMGQKPSTTIENENWIASGRHIRHKSMWNRTISRRSQSWYIENVVPTVNLDKLNRCLYFNKLPEFDAH